MNSFLTEVEDIYSRIVDDKSKWIFENRLLYSITNDWKYINNIKIIKFDNFLEYLKMGQKYGRKIVMFGTGFYGKYLVENEFKEIRFEAFVDNNLKEKEVCGLKVISPEELKEKYFDAIVIISPRYVNKEIYDQLIDMGFNKENIINIGEYVESTYLESSRVEQYFEFLPDGNKKESFVDAGCFNGYTSKTFIKWCGGNYSNIWAFEPEKSNYELCKKELDIPNCIVYNMGLFNKEAVLNFNSGLEGSSYINTNGEDKIKVGRLDDILKDEKITFIKMDIEGAELSAIEGAKNIIKNQKPRLAICIYHKKEDILTIPRLIIDYNPDYKFKLRHYTDGWGETVLYAF